MKSITYLSTVCQHAAGECRTKNSSAFAHGIFAQLLFFFFYFVSHFPGNYTTSLLESMLACELPRETVVRKREKETKKAQTQTHSHSLTHSLYITHTHTHTLTLSHTLYIINTNTHTLSLSLFLILNLTH